MSLEKEK